MLVFSVPLGAMAEAPPEEKEVPEASETVEATEAVVETTVPEKIEEATEPYTEEPAEDPTEETEPPAEDTPDESEGDRNLVAEAYASTQKSIMLFDFADNGDYTTRLNYQVTCAYKPNGSGTTRFHLLPVLPQRQRHDPDGLCQEHGLALCEVRRCCPCG